MNNEMKKLVREAAAVYADVSWLRNALEAMEAERQLAIDEAIRQNLAENAVMVKAKAVRAKATATSQRYPVTETVMSAEAATHGKKEGTVRTFAELAANLAELKACRDEVKPLYRELLREVSMIGPPQKPLKELWLTDADLDLLPFGVPTLSSKVRNASGRWRRVLSAPVDQRDAFLLARNVQCENGTAYNALFLTRWEF